MAPTFASASELKNRRNEKFHKYNSRMPMSPSKLRILSAIAPRSLHYQKLESCAGKDIYVIMWWSHPTF